MSRNVVVSAGTASLHITPYGFFVYGRDFLKAAEAFRRSEDRFSIVPYFLYCQSIELGLKAFLLLKGVTKDELRKKPYGHDLVAVLRRCRADGLDEFAQLTQLDVDAITSATSFYDSGAAGRRLQYFDVFMAVTAYKQLPDVEALRRSAAAVVENETLERMYLNAQ